MSSTKDPVTDFDLVAYADGKLDPARAEKVREHLEQDPEAAARVRAYQEQNAELHNRFDPVLEERLPTRLAPLAERETAPSRTRNLMKAAAITLLVAGTGLSGWVLGRTTQASDFAAEAFATDAATAHERAGSQLPNAAEGASAPLRWLTQRVSLDLKTPKLTEYGYKLVAHEKVRLNGQPGVQLIYESPARGRLSVFLRKRWRSSPPTIRLATDSPRPLAYWLDGPVAYGVLGDLPRDDLRAIARTVEGKIAIEPKVRGGSIEAKNGGVGTDKNVQ